ncbi:MAG TPA: EAL domain-containing protein [Steroidobacteraceae bacterium]|nr:EAL domain-containing protein [Steroidobacteraceae bacterium]
MNQLAFGLGALAGLWCAALVFGTWYFMRWRRRNGASSNATRIAVFDQWPTTALVLDPATLEIVAANPAALRSTGYSHEEVLRLPFTELFSAEGAADERVLLARLQDSTSRAPVEMRQRCKDGSILNVEATAHRLMLDERPVLAVTVHDVTVRRVVESKLLQRHQHLEQLAHHDQLTGLPNRLYLAAHLPEALAEAKEKGTLLAVLFLDLDRFKHVNDSRGHETGDKLLKTVAQRIRQTMRAQDVVVRMGGDEFVVVLKDIENNDRVNEAAVRINQALSAPMVVDGRTLVTTVSIGVALYPRDGIDMGELLRHSDTAMYQAKDRGRNNFQLFSPAMDRRLKERIAVEASLRTALQTGQLEVHYQPIVDIESHQVAALEALMRWKHPSQGFVRPERFVRIAEDAGLIVPIGDFVLQRAIEDMVRWRQTGAELVPVAINVSAVQLQRANLTESIARLTKQHGLEPTMLQVEITESAVFERREARAHEAAQDTVAKLRELGVHIAIDDFGTGYSSLSYLKRWRVDTLKIDRSFVRDLVTDMSDLAIVSAIIAMARHLHIEVVAEGIEGWPQLEKLRALGCSYAQGYLFARPVTAEDCRRFLTGEPLDLTQRLPVLEILEATGTQDARPLRVVK